MPLAGGSSACAGISGHALYQQYFPHGGGSIFTFEVKGGQEAWRFIDALHIFSLLANVADVKSLVIHPYTTTHSQLSPEELEQQHITPAGRPPRQSGHLFPRPDRLSAVS